MAQKPKIRLAINGFGRIGRQAFKIALTNQKVEVVAINDLTEPKVLAYLLQRDSVYGYYDKKVTSGPGFIAVSGKKIAAFAVKEPNKLPWKKLGIDVVLECTGFFTDAAGARLHLKAGAKKVVISAPGKDDVEHTYVFGTELTATQGGSGQIMSNASCTTNSIGPVMQVLERAFGIEKAMMSTIHAYTASQGLVDEPNRKDLREGRAAALNIVPTHTGAAEATAKVIPSLVNYFTGISIRVPVPCGSLSDITCLLKKNVTVDQVNNALRRAAKQPLYRGIIEVSDEPLVSSDIVGNPHSAIVDAAFTRVVAGNLVKVLAWYDNEWGYSNRLVEMALLAAHR